MTVEKRVLTSEIEVRDNEEEKGLTVSGYAVRYNEESKPLEYGFKEIIKPNAFTDSIKKRNIVALYNHDSNELLASTKADTLRLEERDEGIFFELDLLEERKEIYNLIKRGDLSNMSFGFTCEDEKFSRNGDSDIREVRKGTLVEISAVHSPAYETSTVVAQRSLDKYQEFKGEDKMTEQNTQQQTEQQPEEKPEGMGIEMMTRQAEVQPNEIRMYHKGENLGNDKNIPSLGGLIRSYVT